MIKVIDPISREVLIRELTPDRFVRYTNYGKNEIYIVTYQDAPNVVKEIGRLREIAFRNAGGGTGSEYDLDDYDLSENAYKQLLVWNPEIQEILGGYRFALGKHTKSNKDGRPELATAELFNFSDTFIKDYLPYTIELGRSFVQTSHQISSKQGIFTLDNLWDGLGSLVVDNPDMKYFIGKVTMFMHFNARARDLILYFLKKQFDDKDNLITPIESLKINTPIKDLEEIFTGSNYKEDYKILSKNVRDLKENIPPLINSYMNLSPTLKSFGTVLHKEFGEAEETGVMITVKDVYEIKKERHLATYTPIQRK